MQITAYSLLMRRKHNINHLCWVITQLLTGDTDLGLDQLDLAGIPHDTDLGLTSWTWLVSLMILTWDFTSWTWLGSLMMSSAMAEIPAVIVRLTHREQYTLYGQSWARANFFFYCVINAQLLKLVSMPTQKNNPLPPMLVVIFHPPPFLRTVPSHLLPTENLTHHGGHPPPLLAVKLIPPCTH